jgi:hypothetical protein
METILARDMHVNVVDLFRAANFVRNVGTGRTGVAFINTTSGQSVGLSNLI